MTEVQEKFSDAVNNATERVSKEDSRILDVFSPNSNASVHEKGMAILMARENANIRNVLEELWKLTMKWRKYPKSAWEIEYDVFEKFCWDGTKEDRDRFFAEQTEYSFF